MPISLSRSIRNPVTEALEGVLSRAAEVQSGAVADYIPELAKADPEALAISATSVLGNQYRAG